MIEMPDQPGLVQGVGHAEDVNITRSSRTGLRPLMAPTSGLALVFGAAAVLLVMWTVVLGSVLRTQARVTNWSVAWIGLDLAEAVALLSCALLIRRRSSLLSPVAAASATLIIVDAWFDVLTSANDRHWYVSVALALIVEIPGAVICGLISWRSIHW
jgi:hypothetical protein